MKKTHKWLGVALCAMAFGGSAQAQKLMVVEMQDSADNWSCALSKISAATFLNGQISFGADEGETTTTLKAIDLKGISLPTTSQAFTVSVCTRQRNMMPIPSVQTAT